MNRQDFEKAGYYELGDSPTREEIDSLNWKGPTLAGEHFQPAYRPHDKPNTVLRIMAIKTGEFREPQAGEWYLSGSPGNVDAYKTLGGLSTKYYIARLVVVEEKTTVMLRMLP